MSLFEGGIIRVRTAKESFVSPVYTVAREEILKEAMVSIEPEEDSVRILGDQCSIVIEREPFAPVSYTHLGYETNGYLSLFILFSF